MSPPTCRYRGSGRTKVTSSNLKKLLGRNGYIFPPRNSTLSFIRFFSHPLFYTSHHCSPTVNMAVPKPTENLPPKTFDLLSWVLSNKSYDQHQIIYIDPDHPKRSITAAEVQLAIKKLIAGFKALGLKKGDCVCVHAFNDVSTLLLRLLHRTLYRDSPVYLYA